MNKLALIMLLGMASAVLIMPFISVNRDTLSADVYVSDEFVVLRTSEGFIRFPSPDDRIYSSDDPLDFFPELLDPASIQRAEILPYGDGMSCNILKSNGESMAGRTDFCLVLSMKLGIPTYVHKDLVGKQKALTTGSLQA